MEVFNYIQLIYIRKHSTIYLLYKIDIIGLIIQNDKGFKDLFDLKMNMIKEIDVYL